MARRLVGPIHSLVQNVVLLNPVSLLDIRLGAFSSSVVYGLIFLLHLFVLCKTDTLHPHLHCAFKTQLSSIPSVMYSTIFRH